MGDMKTPDFDDLLAAFDIPDIDAKEAIQSTPEEVESHNVMGKPGDPVAPPLNSNSPLDPQVLPPPAQGDTTIVSVIVKNRVRSDSAGGTDPDSNKEAAVSNPGPGTGSVAGNRPELGSVLMGSRLGPRMPGLVLSQPANHNSFGTTAMSQTQSNGEIWPPCSPKTASEGGVVGVGVARRDSSAMDRSKPLIGQCTGDPSRKGLKMGLLKQPESCSAPSFATSAPEASAEMSAPFFPIAKPVLPAVSCPSSLPVSPHFSHPRMYPSPPLQTSQMLNRNQKVGSVVFQHLGSDEEDSEPDVGSPLVIQESPESPVCTPPKLSQYHRSPPAVFQSSSSQATPTTSSNKLGGMVPNPRSPPSPSLSQFPQYRLPLLPAIVNNQVQEDFSNSEHVIEERDSPESPEPEMTRGGGSTSTVSPKDTSSPSLTSAVAETKKDKEVLDIKKESVELKINNTDGLSCDKASVRDGASESSTTKVKTEAEDGETGTANMDKPLSEGSVPPSRPLKVRIKTVKTSGGSITRTVTRVAPKVVQSSKVLSGGRSITNRHRKIDVEGSRVLQPKNPVMALSTLQDASSAMLLAASKAQNKLATSMSDKGRISSTAGNAAKNTPLHSSGSGTPSSSKISSGVGGVSVRSAAAKSVNSYGSPTSDHQLSKPASIVNNAGAAISRSQSSLVEAFNKILNSKNLLPSYRPDLSTPPPAEWSLPIPANGYRCLECGDTFALERSLARHYDRRSLRIEVTCNHCAKRLAFFNKCSLLLHAREHKESGLVMQCSHLVMRPVPIEQMVGQQDTMPIGVLSPARSSSLPPSAPVSAGSVAPVPLKEGHASQNSPARRIELSQACIPLLCHKVEPLQYHNFRCPECHTKFGGISELAAHFQEVKPDSNTTCSVCSPAMMLPNGCSAAAHQRIHKHRAPHVCPECGGTARQASFQAHLDEACLHFARRIGYRCSSCSVVFGGLNSIKTHIQLAHCEVFHKCPNCPMAFKSSAGAANHISSQHPSLSTSQAKMIYKCVMCDTVFTQKPLLYMHFDTHLAKQKVHVFKCPDCTKLYAQKGSMMDHVKNFHRSSSVKDEAPASFTAFSSALKPKSSSAAENSDGEDWGREQEEDAGEPDAGDASSSPEVGLGRFHHTAPLEWTCSQCGMQFTDREDYVCHMRREHGKSMKKFPCLMCERSFCSAPSLRRHVRVNHEGIKRVFHCQFCTEGKRTFSSRLILENHIQVRHGIRSRARQTSEPSRKRLTPSRPLGGANDSSSEQDGEGDRTGEEEQEERLRSSHGGEEESSEDCRPVKRARGAEAEPTDGRFRCVPCGFSTEDQSEFLQHIPQHRAGAGDQCSQCTQCGACFASASSLSRHCFITHRMRHTQVPPAGAMADRSPSPHGPGEDQEGSLGCRVCGRHFDKASDLNTHFRTHGMAFIAAHKTDKPL